MTEAEAVKTLIRDAFKDVSKKGGIGIREALALDDRLTLAEIEAARQRDGEEPWWDIPEELRPMLGPALSFTDVEGFRFLLPAAMTASLDRIQSDHDAGNSVFFHLILQNHKSGERAPHFGHSSYIGFLQRLSARGNAAHYGFDDKQIHAVARFFNWQMQKNRSHLYGDRAKEEAARMTLQEATKNLRENYSLSIEEAMAVFDEECRILLDWLQLGRVKPSFEMAAEI